MEVCNFHAAVFYFHFFLICNYIFVCFVLTLFYLVYFVKLVLICSFKCYIGKVIIVIITGIIFSFS